MIDYHWFGVFGGVCIFLLHYNSLDGVLKKASSCQSYEQEKGCVDHLAHQGAFPTWKKCINWNLFFAYLKKPQEFKTNESILSILTIIKGEEKYLFTFIYQDLSNDFFRPLEKS